MLWQLMSVGDHKYWIMFQLLLTSFITCPESSALGKSGFNILEDFARRLSTSNEKWKILCFRQEEFPSGDPNPEHVEDNLCEELARPELDKPKAKTRDWISSLQEAADAVLSAIGKPWTVPWTADTILQVTLLWIATFCLLTDATEGLAGIVILYRCLSRFRPLSSDWFRFSLKGNWLFDVVLGCLMFPLVNRLAQFNLDLLPLLPSTPVTLSNVEQSIVARDPVAMALYTLVVSVCAPVWEEIVFRGFLLPSLTKYMPVWCSILVSSVAFALAHFNIQRMLPLIFLGVVMGVIFARSRNFLPSMLLHSLWNGFVFLDLMK
ncbi:CAAX amino terminal protease family protein [Actinidia rufa]|uniref:CAAX amino terminal protease family protein n=1 Tax=Actinidia rufa TaxID=165716 RepID=A0A7J0FRY0_9ERIC|nr:CAAX amino terminal protease family protein [Actinidia rufa]